MFSEFYCGYEAIHSRKLKNIFGFCCVVNYLEQKPFRTIHMQHPAKFNENPWRAGKLRKLVLEGTYIHKLSPFFMKKHFAFAALSHEVWRSINSPFVQFYVRRGKFLRALSGDVSISVISDKIGYRRWVYPKISSEFSHPRLLLNTWKSQPMSCRKNS